jgi:hypothetical protein
MKYKDVAALFARARYPSKGKPVTSNTRLFMLDDGKYALRYHDTDIITWYLDGRILLCNGGWATVSTHRNMNRFIPSSIRVYAKNFKTEVDLKRSYMNAESVWTQTKHITKPAYDTPKNFKAVSVNKQMYGTRVTYFMLEPLDNGGKEYRLDNAMVVIQ